MDFRKPVLAVVFAFSCLTAQTALASPSGEILKTMISMKLTSRSVVNHNLSVYRSLLLNLEADLLNPSLFHKQKKRISLTALDEFERRLQRQMTYATPLTEWLAPDVEALLTEGRKAARRYDHQQLIGLIRKANAELLYIGAYISVKG